MIFDVVGRFLSKRAETQNQRQRGKAHSSGKKPSAKERSYGFHRLTLPEKIEL